jgi:MFS family permease
MKKFILYFIALRTCWSVIEFMSLMICEKSIELLTKDVTSIMMVRLLFVTVYLVFLVWSKSIIPSFSNQLSIKKILAVTSIALSIGALGQAYIPFWGYYILIVVTTSTSLIFVPCVSYLMYKGVKYDSRPKVISRVAFLSSSMGIASYLAVSIVATSMERVQYITVISVLVCALTYFFLSRCLKIWMTHDTRDHFILNQHQVNASASLRYNKVSWKLKDSIGMTGILIIFSIYQVLYSSIDSMNTAYVHDVLKKGQEAQFLFVGIFMVGVASVALYRSFIVSRIRTSYMLQNSLMFVAIYMFVLSQKASIWYLYVLLFLLGAMSGIILVATNLSVHQNSRPVDLPKRLLMYNMIIGIGPVVSNGFIWIAFKYTKFPADQIAMVIAFACMGIISCVTLIRFFKPRTKDMTYSQYK